MKDFVARLRFKASFVVLRQRLTLYFRLVWNSRRHSRLALNLDQSSCLSHLCAGIKDVSHQVYLCTSFLKAMEKQRVFESEQMVRYADGNIMSEPGRMLD